jgi:hypothetical protein
MPLEAPNIGDILLLKYMLNVTPATNKVIHLYTNDPNTSDKTLTSANISESTDAGYAPITLAGSMWTFTNIANVVTAIYSEVDFTFTTGTSLYGYYITSTVGNTELCWLERFSGAPFTLPSGGGTIAVLTKLILN